MSAFSRAELLVSLAALGLLALVVLPMGAASRTASHRATCVNNLSRIGQAFSSWTLEHDERYPWQVAISAGGTQNAIPGLLNHFRAISNELVTPVVLACPADAVRTRAFTFVPTASVADSPLNNSQTQISYFLAHPFRQEGRSILSGDRNLSNASTLMDCSSFGGALFYAPPAATPGWDRQIHVETGQLLFSDGSVEQASNADLRARIHPGYDDPAFHYITQ